MSKRYVVIMAGGRGERFWPQSRLRRPKQLLSIVGDKPLLTQTVERLEGFVPSGNILVITNREQEEAVIEVCPSLPRENIISEPVGRDTAAAVGLALVLVKHRDPEAVFAMLPADHVIKDKKGFQRILEAAFATAEQNDALVTIGIAPDSPATGYGYIKKSGEAGSFGGCPAYEVTAFVEKPDLPTAEKYLDSGDYFWNAGMFIWRVPVIEREFAQHTPGLYDGLQKIGAGLNEGEALTDLLSRIYPELEKISIDYAVMEKAGRVLVIESDFDWDDVGSWPAVERHFPKDEQGNVLRGAAIVHEGKGNIVLGGDDHLVAVVGAEDLIVVRTADATLVCPKSKAEALKKLVAELGRDERYRPLT